MEYVKFIIKDEYKDKDGIVYHPLLNAFKKVGANSLLDNNKAFLLGYIMNDELCEFFTGRNIEIENYEIINKETIKGIVNKLNKNTINHIYSIIEAIVFNIQIQSEQLVIDNSNMEKRGLDGDIQSTSYDDYSTDSNHYSKEYCYTYNNPYLVSRPRNKRH